MFLRFVAFWVKFGHTAKAAWRLMHPIERVECADRKAYFTESVVHA